VTYVIAALSALVGSIAGGLIVGALMLACYGAKGEEENTKPDPDDDLLKDVRLSID
jgi:hypothetical protein